MMDRKESSFKKTWDILLPFAVYFVVHDLSQVLLAALVSVSLEALGGAWRDWMLRNEGSVNGILNALSLLGGMAAVWPMAMKEFRYLKEEREGHGTARKAETGEQPRAKRSRIQRRPAAYALLIVFAASFALGMNILLGLTGLTGSSPAYGEVARRQYGVAFGIGLLVYGICSPLAEEVVFRGLIYNRMKRYFPGSLSVAVCSLLFGIYHGNLVQAVYGCILGIAMTLAYEAYGSFWAPVLFHGAANACVFAAGYNQEVLQGLMTPLNCMIFLIISISSMVGIGILRK